MERIYSRRNICISSIRKKKPKIIITLVALLLIAALAVVLVISFKPKQTKVKEVKVLKSIDEYGYQLKDNKTKKYKDMFKELEDILRADTVDEEAYAKKIAEMFVYDFFSLEDKAAKTDVGGVDFVHPNAVANFLFNAEDTYYKYVESNIYGERKQELPAVDTVTASTYTNEKFADYQKTALVILIKNELNYYVVQI